jgi:aminoglycoside phosphotransferase (APT) family kinase protein
VKSTTKTLGVTLFSNFKHKVVRYGDKVVKSGPDILPSEAETMRFIAAKTSIPIPRVYEEGSDPVPSITMDYVEGVSLDTVWNWLPEEQKLDLADQLKGLLSELRSLKGQYIGSLHRGKASDGRRFDLKGGPFDTEDEFNHFLLSDRLKATPTILHDIALRSLRTDHEIVFTHADFTPRNIMVKDGRVVALLDWEYSGWYPEYWEFVKTFNAADHRVNWYNYVGLIFPKCYKTEYINDRFLGSILRH